jgi:hypothetical protein
MAHDPSDVTASAVLGNEDIQEFPLLLEGSVVRELIEAARQQGLSAASLARCLIRNYLRNAYNNT